MRFCLIVSSLVTLLAAVGSTNANPIIEAAALVRRFHLKDMPVRRVENLTEPAKYARALTHHRPTRRLTARAADVSELPIVPLGALLSVANLNTNSPLGNLLVTPGGLSLTVGGGGSSLSTEASPSWVTKDQRRISIDSLSASFPYLGLVQFTPTSGLAIGSGLSNGLLLTGIQAPGTAPGAQPAYLNNYANGPSNPVRGGETDIWSINYSTGALSATWVNPDSSSSQVTFVTNGVEIAATGDVDAFNNAFGGDWITVSLKYFFNA